MPKYPCQKNGERIAKIEEWKELTEKYLGGISKDVKKINRNMWIAVGVILTIQAILKFPAIAMAISNLIK